MFKTKTPPAFGKKAGGAASDNLTTELYRIAAPSVNPEFREKFLALISELVNEGGNHAA